MKLVKVTDIANSLALPITNLSEDVVNFWNYSDLETVKMVVFNSYYYSADLN